VIDPAEPDERPEIDLVNVFVNPPNLLPSEWPMLLKRVWNEKLIEIR
jgi:hypothetical protein